MEEDNVTNRQPPTAHTKAMELARRMLKMVESGTTDQAAAIREIAAYEYLDSTRYQAECDRLFRIRPVFAGFSCEIAASGQFKTLDLPGFPVIIVRGADNCLRAFLNACRHRGSRLVNQAGRTQRFICPYHGWSYELNGALHQVRSEALFGTVDKDCRGLVEIGAGEAYGLVYVRATPLTENAAPVDVDMALGGLGPQMAEWQLEQTVPMRNTIIPVAANWKLTVSTYLETYHFGVLHPRTVAQTHFSDHATFDTYGPNQLTGFTGRQIGRLSETPEAEWEPLRHLQFIYFLFPNTVLTVMRDHTEYFQTLPGPTADAATTNYVYFTYPDSKFSSAEVANDRFERELAILLEEDCPMAESMQRTMASGALRSVLLGRNEPGLQHFHRCIEEILGQ